MTKVYLSQNNHSDIRVDPNVTYENNNNTCISLFFDIGLLRPTTIIIFFLFVFD